ncbi:MAG TPA: hypothetical protein VJ596_00990, partial [Gemmatimonadaceae bacterium]|nr:hypothetical protein [Gemmatimonadaceae bacterium]
MRPRVRGLALLVLVAASSGVSSAQVVATLDAGTGSIRYDDVQRSLVLSVSPTVVRNGSSSTLLATGTVSQFANGGWSAQGLVAGSLFTRAFGPVRGELAGRAGLNAHREILRVGQLLGLARAHLVSEERGVWVGGALGRSWMGGAGEHVSRADAGAWTRLGGALLRVSVARTRIRDSMFTNTPPLNPPPGSSPYARFTNSYSDAEAGMEWRRGRVALDATIGQRFGDHVREVSSWSVGGSVRLSNHIALLAATGRYPADLTQSLPGGRYASLALRFSLNPRAARRLEEPAATALAFETTRGDDDAQTFNVYAPRARRVELMGDFTDWHPVALSREGDGRWT